ncbi:DUF3097 domain-containing protein [Microbacterium sp. H1-D42]|uniref:DUF3097 domain-containing protein n=1 Tax=Microbacterium sp. H1-D42 TaxID=2925844 RepID=UPI001F534415|nr:DUF3097 domain-containing protein [Microbacterium sp. H1-D42]UNK69642.1 DUF3097 domain-containing protein [Microbacterium sp. H1-D42]
MDDRYSADVLAEGWRDRDRVKAADVAAVKDLVVEVADDGYCGAITRVEAGLVELEDWKGRRRSFPLGAGFLIEGRPVRLVVEARQQNGTRRTASGSFVAADDRARTALPSRILVEGRHDAELVEKVWGADLRVEGVVVEYLQGIDKLDELLAEAPPTATRRYGVLVDHLVAGSKETRIVDQIMRGPHGANLKIVGHPYIDVWQCVTPAAMGIRAWPQIPRGTDWKTGICQAFGWPAEDQTDIAHAWQRILARVTTFRDLEPALLGRVEELIDFVTDPSNADPSSAEAAGR